MNLKNQLTRGNLAKNGMTSLREKINFYKRILFYNSFVMLIVSTMMFSLCLYLRFKIEIQEWVEFFKVKDYNIAMEILIIAIIVLLVIAFIGCISAVLESPEVLYLNVAIQILGFLVLSMGTVLLLNYSTLSKDVEPIIRETMTDLIDRSDKRNVSVVLNAVQKRFKCCGADGAEDYITLKRILPDECRNIETRNVYDHGCVDEISWFFHERSDSIVALAIVLSFINIVQAVFSIILAKDKKKFRALNTHNAEIAPNFEIQKV